MVKPTKKHHTKHTDRTRRKVRATIDDVYEYAPSKVRRAKVRLSLDRHETEGRQYGSGDEIDLNGMDQEAMEKLRARLVRDDEDEDGVDSEDDEDIDSEDAFEDSDKEEFAGSAFVRTGAKTGAARRKRDANGKGNVAKEVDLNEDSDAHSKDPRSASESKEDEDEEMDDGSDDEFFDVLDVFDGRATIDDDEDPSTNVDKRASPIEAGVEWKGEEDVGMSEDDGSEDVDEEDGDEDEDELHISASDAEDPSPEALANLEAFLSNLDPTASNKRKPDQAATKPNPQKRRRIADRTEAGEEHEFGVRGASTLKLDDLLTPLASSSSFAALKKATKPLTSSSTKTQTLAAPLPQRAQERLDREAAYEQTKEEVQKWSATMKRIKEAEHLSFPLQAEKPTRVSNLELAAKFTPSNALESAVDKLLKSAQLRDQDIEHTEALKMAHLSVDEVAARRAELRVMRELTFRADKKAKRIAKIKSKAYRRIRKKQRERLDGAGEDGNVDVADEEDRLKAEMQRARERATLRHKNTGKWAKAMNGRQGLDQDQRQAITEMLDRGEKLRRRIHGENSDDEGSEHSESDEEEQDEDAIKRDAFEELSALRAEDDTDLPELKSKTVFNMKFMREAAARQAREADAQAEELQKELGFGIDGREDENENENENENEVPSTETTMVQRTGGRLSFRPGTTPGTLRPLGSLASDTSSVTLQSADLLQDIPAPEATPTPCIPTSTPTTTSNPNPWLQSVTSSGPSRKRNEVRVHKDADTLTKSSNKLKKQADKHHDERERARDDAVLEIDAHKLLTMPEPLAASAPGKQRKATANKGVAKTTARPTSAAHDGDDDSDVPSELEEQERTVGGKGKQAGKGVQAFQQRDLVALAFAGDNVVQAFEEAKRHETEADAPHEVDTTLPGWGAWGGMGTKPRPPKPHLLKSVPGIIPTARADHAKPHLIISEKRDKKAHKYLVRELPHPYTSHAQFERRMETPLGSEWNTRVGFQRGTLPRVVKKMGTVIDPLERMF